MKKGTVSRNSNGRKTPLPDPEKIVPRTYRKKPKLIPGIKEVFKKSRDFWYKNG